MRVFAAKISFGLTATAFAAAALVGASAVGLTPSPTEAATIPDHGCALTGSACGTTTGTYKKPRNLAARALSNKVVMDVMLGNAKSNPDLTVGCGTSGLCVTLIPDHATGPDDLGIPGILALTRDSSPGSQGFSSPSVDSAFLSGAPTTRRFAGRSSRTAANSSGGPAFSTGLTGAPGSNSPGGNPEQTPGPGGSDNPGGPGGPGGSGSPGGPGGQGTGGGGTGGGGGGDGGSTPPNNDQGNNEGPNDPGRDPITVVDPPFIDVDQPTEVIRVPEPSTLFIFGFALLAMTAFGARQMQTATSGNRSQRTRR